MSPSVHSQKVTAFTRFTFATGSTCGFVLFTPSLANDSCQAFYSSSAYAGADASTCLSSNNNLATGVATATIAGLPFSTSELTTLTESSPVAQGRIISYTYQITYTGTTLNEGGLYYNYVSPTHSNVSTSFVNTGQLGGALETEVCGTTRNPCGGAIFACTPNELMYAADAADSLSVTSIPIACVYPFSSMQGGAQNNVSGASHFSMSGTSTTYYVGGPVGTFITTGASGVYLCELVIHAEFIGSATASMATPNYADPEGAQKVLAAANTLPQRKLSSPANSMIENMALALRESYAVNPSVPINSLVTGTKSAGRR
jgi:hypothetical protein